MSTNSNPQNSIILLKMNAPTLKMQKMVKVSLSDSLWNFKLLLLQKLNIKEEGLNFVFYFNKSYLNEQAKLEQLGIPTEAS